MPSNQTPNYRLSQWERTDRVLMEDFNADNAKIDGALKAEADARAAGDAALQAALVKKGNVRAEFYTYTGTGTSGSDSPPCLIPFTNGEPLLIMVLGGGKRTLVLYRGSGESVVGNSLVSSSWSNSGVSWYSYKVEPQDQLNVNGRTYTALMFYKLD